MATKKLPKKSSRPKAGPAPVPAVDAGGSRLGIGLTFGAAALLLATAVFFTYHRNASAQTPDPSQSPAAAQPQQPPPPQDPGQVQPQAPAQPASKTDASLAPDFSLVNVADGKTVTLSKLRGKVVLIDFWATWCPPCRMTIPHLMDLQKEYGGKRFTVVGISLDQQGEAVVKPFYESWKMNYPVVIDQDGSVARNYGGIRSIPTGLLIDRKGHVINGFIGYRPKEEIEGYVKQALASKS
jgi:cytochrome c biogenesis protein CcmG/thiol:disulfide interchange protein DsbE